MLILVWFVNFSKCHVVVYKGMKSYQAFLTTCVLQRKCCSPSARPQVTGLNSALRNWLHIRRVAPYSGLPETGPLCTCCPCVVSDSPQSSQKCWCHTTWLSYLTWNWAVCSVASLTGILYFSVVFLRFLPLHLRVLTYKHPSMILPFSCLVIFLVVCLGFL